MWSDGESSAAGAQADDDLARPRADTERGGHVVARAGSDRYPRRQPQRVGRVGQQCPCRFFRAADLG